MYSHVVQSSPAEIVQEMCDLIYEVTDGNFCNLLKDQMIKRTELCDQQRVICCSDKNNDFSTTPPPNGLFYVTIGVDVKASFVHQRSLDIHERGCDCSGIS